MSLSQDEIKIVRPVLESFVTALLNERPKTRRQRTRLRRTLTGLRPGLDLHRLQRAIVISEPAARDMLGACGSEKTVDRLVSGMMSRLNQRLVALSGSSKAFLTPARGFQRK